MFEVAHIPSLNADILYIASLGTDTSSFLESTRVTLNCFSESLKGIFEDPDHLGDLPEINRPTNGSGFLINLTGKKRWQPFATWIIKLLGKCLAKGTMDVEGLISMSDVSATCSLLCYEDSDLQVASG